MTAIAQTLDETETFGTKAELFDYVVSQLFNYPVYNTGGVCYLEIEGLVIEVQNVEFSM